LLIGLLAAAPAFAEERKLVVNTIEGVLSRAEAAALEEAVRTEARSLAIAVTSEDPDFAMNGKSVRLEGALAVTLSVVKLSSGTRVATERLVGFSLADLQKEANKKIPRLLRAGLGLEPPPPPSTPAPPAPPAPAATPTPAAAATPAAVPLRQATPVPPLPPPVVASTLPALPPPSRITRPGPRNRAPTHVTGISESSPLVRSIQKVIEDVEDVRGLWRKTTLQVVILGDEAFSNALRAKAKSELTPAIVAAERARWTAFGLAPPDVDPAKLLVSVLDEQVAGFYDPSTKALTVREHPPASAGAAADTFELVLAHEVQHALQDQHFGFPDMARLDDDARLARMALYEGDAMATMIAVAARRAGSPVKLSIMSGASAMRSMSGEQLAQSAGYSPELVQAPAIVREELAMPYGAGLGLVAEVFRHGGFALVDKMFEHPPQSTHQVLHPEAYLSGDLPVAVPYPSAPLGMQVIARGRMGELGARVALQVCVDEQVASEFAQHWAGDAYTIVRTSPDSLGLLWSTVWSGDSARAFSNLLGMQSSCWEEMERTGRDRPPFISALAQVRVDGKQASLARGLTPGAVAIAAANAVKFDARVPPRAPPLGQVRDDDGATRAVVANGRFVSTRLRVEGDIPIGFDADVGQPSAEIVVRRSRPQASASLVFVPQSPTTDAMDAFFQSAATTFANELGGSSLKLSALLQTTLLGKSAQERAWEVQGTRAMLRVTLAPACGGKGYYALLRSAVDESSRPALDNFARMLKASSPDDSPACAELQ
jgi:hypothetical protein